MNLLYIGEIFLLVTAIIGLIAFLGTSQTVIEVRLISSILFALITVTCALNLLNFLYYAWRGHLEIGMITRVTRNTILFLALEFTVLTIVVLVFRFYTWSFVRFTAIFLLLSGCFGILLLFLSAKTITNKDSQLVGVEHLV